MQLSLSASSIALLLLPVVVLGGWTSSSSTGSWGNAWRYGPRQEPLDHWSYDRCARGGPQDWTELGEACAGTKNSPIDLCDTVGFGTYTAPEIVTDYTAADSKVSNNGHSVKLSRDDTVNLLQAGNLGYIVGRSEVDTVFTYRLAQAHLHWGRSTTEGSEHFMNGRQYPAEIHLVHYNDKYGSVGEAAGNSDGLMVIGVMLEIGATEHPAYTTLMNAFADNAEHGGDEGMIGSALNADDLLPASREYLSYAGGLTTPTCNEAVTWVVMQNTMSITWSSLDKLRNTKEKPGLYISKHGNYRPLQAHNGRLVYDSAGTYSAACFQSWSEPEFACADH